MVVPFVMAVVFIMTMSVTMTAVMVIVTVLVVRYVFVVIPVVSDEVDRPATGVVLGTVLTPVFLMAWRHV